MMTDRDYVLGTDAREIERLGLQHRVWRPRMLAGWQRAGIGVGQTVIDVGAGPGYAALDLAEIVGPGGTVVAVERSARFLDALKREAAARGLENIELREQDAVDQGFGEAVADAAWCRWVLSFVSDPARVVAHIASALKPGGVAVFHEYANYGAWTLAPPDPRLDRFIGLVMKSWRDAGGEPDIGLRLPELLHSAKLDVVAVSPMIETVRPTDYMWQWPAAFTRVNAERLRELGEIDAAEARSLASIVEDAALDPASWMVTPLVFEVVARRPEM